MPKKDMRKWIKIQIRNSDKVINELDGKYNYFENDEEMSNEDNSSYSYNDGIKCSAMTVIAIINKKKYISKDAYKQTDWKSKGLLS